MEILRVENLTKVYGSGHTAVSALREASLVAGQGELVAVLGPERLEQDHVTDGRRGDHRAHQRLYLRRRDTDL
jgi:hypothetical protein